MARRTRGIMVKVARTGTKAIEVALNDERTVEDAIEAASLVKKASEEIYVNGEPVESDFELDDGDRIILVKSIEGGRNLK